MLTFQCFYQCATCEWSWRICCFIFLSSILFIGFYFEGLVFFKLSFFYDRMKKLAWRLVERTNIRESSNSILVGCCCCCWQYGLLWTIVGIALAWRKCSWLQLLVFVSCYIFPCSINFDFFLYIYTYICNLQVHISLLYVTAIKILTA